MNDHLSRAEKTLEWINELASISEDENFIVRTYGTDAFLRGRDKIQQWMKDAGLETRVDNIGNIRGRLLSKNKNAKTFIIASHIDTVVNAGKFDGPLGVLMGLDLLEEIKRQNIPLPFHIELIGFCDEEGCRFHSTYLGSKVIVGSLDKNILNAKDTAGISLEDVIKQNGGDVNKLSKDAIAKQDCLGYFEMHIEQGPVLYEKDIPVATVSAISGQRRAGMVFNGEAGHAGTVPMKMRKDALTCASEFILAVEKYAAEHHNDLVATIGKLHIINAASNVIPGEVITSLDIRSADENKLETGYNEIKAIAETICNKRGIVLEWSVVQETKPVICDNRMSRLLAESIGEAGFEKIELVSGAGHDAVPLSEIAPVAMLFIRCFKGISHNPLENVDLKDIAAAIKVSDTFIKKWIAIHNS
jgi:allantoate deiminase